MYFKIRRVKDGPNGDGRSRAVLVDQILWLITLRWMATVLVVAGAMLGTLVFPVLTNSAPLYVVAALLLGCNCVYALAVRGIDRASERRRLILAIVQIEIDLLALTAVLFFSGGTVNPFFLFYVFHVIIATIILPRHLSFMVGLTTILLFGLLAANELHAGALLGHYPLQLSAGGGLWRNPVYGLAAFVAFAFTVVLSQHLTHVIIVRMKAKEMEAARNSDLLQAIINAMAEGLIFVTDDGRVSLCNPAAEGWRQEQSGGNGNLLERFPEALADHIRALSGSGNAETQGHKIQFSTAGPVPRFIEAGDYPVVGLDGARLGHVIVGEDLTEHKKLEADLLERTEQLTAINEMLKMSRVRMAQREKMVALGQMAAGIAHEIGNPLTSLSSVVQYLSRKCSDARQKELCAVVDHHVGRISAILKHMLGLARPATSAYTWVDINEVIENTLSFVRFDKRARDVTIVNAGAVDLPTVWLNRQNLEQCLLNVVINALDALDAKGAAGRRQLEVTKAVKDEMVEIRVSDTGVGMSPEVCQRAFESFFTTKEISKGTGLGLFICYNLLAEVDGTIELESQRGDGTTAIIRIPVRPKRDPIGTSKRKGRG
jgi:signal transduction histidine kinase